MKNFLLFLTFLPLLISCGNSENMSALNSEGTERADSRSSSRSGRGKQDNKRGVGSVYFNFKVGGGEEYKESSDKKAVIIVSLDASSSMRPFLKKAGKTFKGFTSALSPLDWTLVFVRADGNHWLSSKGRPMKLEHEGSLLWETRQLTPDMKDHASIFTDTLRLHKYNEYHGGHDGASTPECQLPPGCQWGWNEKPMLSLSIALTKNSVLIEEADVVISIMISNSDEGVHSNPEDRITAKQLKAAFYKTYKKPWINYGIIMKKGDASCLEQSRGFFSEDIYSVRIAEMAKETGGANFGFCEESYVPLAKKIVSDIQKIK